MQPRNFVRAIPSLSALGVAVFAGLIECVALWRSRHRQRGESPRRS